LRVIPEIQHVVQSCAGDLRGVELRLHGRRSRPGHRRHPRLALDHQIVCLAVPARPANAVTGKIDANQLVTGGRQLCCPESLPVDRDHARIQIGTLARRERR
jgi:hypothetical protein